MPWVCGKEMFHAGNTAAWGRGGMCSYLAPLKLFCPAELPYQGRSSGSSTGIEGIGEYEHWHPEVPSPVLAAIGRKCMVGIEVWLLLKVIGMTRTQQAGGSGEHFYRAERWRWRRRWCWCCCPGARYSLLPPRASRAGQHWLPHLTCCCRRRQAAVGPDPRGRRSAPRECRSAAGAQQW